MEALSLAINIDGAARGNPGPAAYAFVISHDGEPILEENGRLGSATNNVAEYTALVKALEKAAELRAAEVLIRSDSELLVKQMRGEYKVKNEALRALWQEAGRLIPHFRSVKFTHVPREQNKEADRLCNEALDESLKGRVARSERSEGRGGSLFDAKPRPSKTPGVPPRLLSREETAAAAERLLERTGRLWIETGRLEPSPGQVAEQLLKLLQE